MMEVPAPRRRVASPGAAFLALGAAACVALCAAACVALCAASPAPDAARAAGEAPPAAPADGWLTLEPGLDLGTFRAPGEARRGDGRVRVLRVDPGRFVPRLLNASAPSEGRARSARDWAARHGLVAAINASMYQTDLRTSVSLMRTAGHVNNPRLTRDRAILAFDPLDPALPPVQIIDRECQDDTALRPRYASLIQSIRMVACDGRNVWAPQPRAFSTAAIGTDHDGRLLLLHAATPFTTHDFIDILLALPIGLKSALYAEGGREAQLFVASGGRAYEFTGLPEGAGAGAPRTAPPIPNVVGVARRPR